MGKTAKPGVPELPAKEQYDPTELSKLRLKLLSEIERKEMLQGTPASDARQKAEDLVFEPQRRAPDIPDKPTLVEQSVLSISPKLVTKDGRPVSAKDRLRFAAAQALRSGGIPGKGAAELVAPELAEDTTVPGIFELGQMAGFAGSEWLVPGSTKNMDTTPLTAKQLVYGKWNEDERAIEASRARCT